MSTGKTIILSLLVCLAALATTFFVVLPAADDAESRASTTLINPVTGEVLFVHQKVWGIAADHRVVFISGRNGAMLEPNTHTDYVYNGLSAVLYKQQRDTLTIYCCGAAAVPARINTSFVIRQVALDNAAMMRLVENGRYRQEGMDIVEIR